MLGFGHADSALGALSFKLHAELAAQHNGRENWGYSRSTGSSMTEGPRNSRSYAEGGSRAQMAATHEYSGEQKGPAWLTRRHGDKIETLSEDGGVAQVYVRPQGLSRSPY